MEDHAKEIEHSSLQEKFDRELRELDKKLEQKEVKVAGYGFKLMKTLTILFFVCEYLYQNFQIHDM